jgi:spermidine synthase
MKMLKKLFKNPIFYSITALGLSAIITQILVMREFLSVFYGNELVLGIILANWLLLIGVGSYLGKYFDKVKNKVRLLIFSQLIIGILPLISIFIIRALRGTIFLQGEMVGITQIFFSSFLLLLPYCIITGYLLTLACMLFSTKEESKPIGEIYSIDVFGDILGGILFSFILIFFFNPFQILFIIFFINFLAAMFVAYKNSYIILRSILFLILIIGSIVFFSFDLNDISTRIMFKGQDLVEQKTSLYGNLVVTRTQEQLNFFENGIPLFTTENTIANEETIHYPLLQHSNPKNILLVGGAVAGTAEEILKYNIDKIDYVELDKAVIDFGKKFTKNLDIEKLNIINKDGRRYIKQTNETYDIIIIDLPEPSIAQINRYYTTEFFKEVKNILSSKGILSLSLGPSENYYSEEIRKLNSAQFKSLSKIFSNIIIVPGNNLYFIASDQDLTYNYNELLDKKKITNTYVNKDYLKGILTEDRIENAVSTTKEDVKENLDFTPTSYYFQLINWVKHFEGNYVWLLIVVVILLIILFMRLSPIPFSIFTTGFAGSGLAVIILIGFQIIYGFVYYKIGLLVTAFMIGLALGSIFINKTLVKRTYKSLIKFEFAIVFYSILLPFLMLLFSKFNNNLLVLFSSEILFPVLTIVAGFLVGAEFPLASKFHFKNIHQTAGIIYSSDYIGAAVGAILVSALLIPLFGIVKVSIFIGLLNLLSAIILIRKNMSIPFGFAILFTGLIAYFGFLILNENYSQLIYNLSYHPTYIAVALIALFVGLFIILFLRKMFNESLKRKILRLVSFIIFFPVIFYPIFRCYFKIPYIFCHVCPRKCIFGYLRPVLVPGVLIQNVDARFWCYNQCPIGNLQDAQCKRSLRIPNFLKHIIRLLVLVLIVVAYFWIKYSRENEVIQGSSFFLYMFQNGFTFSLAVLIVSIIIFIISFFIKRFWCNYFCPVGTVSDYVLMVERKFNKEKNSNHPNTLAKK